jgi:hypothetical protein
MKNGRQLPPFELSSSGISRKTMIPCSYKADYAQYTVYNPMEDINKEYHSHREFLVAEMIVDEE